MVAVLGPGDGVGHVVGVLATLGPGAVDVQFHVPPSVEPLAGTAFCAYAFDPHKGLAQLAEKNGPKGVGRLLLSSEFARGRSPYEQAEQSARVRLRVGFL